MDRNIRFIGVVVLALLAILLDSASHLLSMIEDGLLMAALVWLAAGMRD